MKFALAKVIAVKPLPKHRLALTFADGAKGTYDCTPLLWGEAFEPLTDPMYFAQVFLDRGAPSWPNGADLDPGVLREAIENSAHRSASHRSKVTLVQEDSAPYGDAPPPAVN